MLKIAICDDTPDDRERMKSLVSEFLSEKGIEAQLKVFDHPDTLIKECELFRPHIFILDIVMPMVTGIEAARELRWNQPDAQIIFASSESSYALESFDVNPINYIIKPVKREKLFDTLELCLKRCSPLEGRSLSIKVKGGIRSVYAEDVYYIDYRNHIVSYHLSDGEVISTPTLRIGFSEYLDENIPAETFVRCHESVSVNLRAVDKLSKNEIVLRNKELIPVSRSRYSEAADKYMEFRLG